MNMESAPLLESPTLRLGRYLWGLRFRTEFQKFRGCPCLQHLCRVVFRHIGLLWVDTHLVVAGGDSILRCEIHSPLLDTQLGLDLLEDARAAMGTGPTTPRFMELRAVPTIDSP